MNNVLVIIPTYNESENIQQLLIRLDVARSNFSKEYKLDFLIIDDSSPDGTAQIAKSVTIEGLKVLIRAKKVGLGPAYLAGFKQGLTGNYDDFYNYVNLETNETNIISLNETKIKAFCGYINRLTT